MARTFSPREPGLQDVHLALRALPQVQRLLEAPEAADLVTRHGRPALTEALRAVLDAARNGILAGSEPDAPSPTQIFERAESWLAARAQRGLRRVINATGIVLHTNLGRAPLAQAAIDAMVDVAAGYCNLEFDLTSGRRGSRTAALEPLLRELTGAEAALAVNNGAAAILLALATLADGGEVIVSRGELVEIGGGFRVPDVIRQGGARLVEVGTTNKTRLADYRAAIGPETRVLLKVHQSNFRTIGFTAETGIDELSGLAHEHGLRVVVDLGSGLLRRGPDIQEPSLAEALAQGADLVTCSGDKLLGGPQAGLIVGRAEAVDPLRKHPLLRAIRLDKLTLAALEATLRLHRDNPLAVPVPRMLASEVDTLQQRAERLRTLLGTGRIESSDAYAGGGALPEERIESRAVSVTVGAAPDAVACALRTGDPSVVLRIREQRLVLDMLTLSNDDLAQIADALKPHLAPDPPA